VQVGVGLPLLPAQEARKPKLVVPPAPSDPFQVALLALTDDPVLVRVEPQACVTA